MKQLLIGSTSLAAVAFGSALLLASPAQASLNTFAVFNGQDAVSTDGCGSVTQVCTLTAGVPAGSTVVAAYLYTSLYFDSANPGPGNALDGTPVNYTTALGFDPTACCTLQAWRSDVTSIVAPIINGGPGGTYTFTINENPNNPNQDGEGLVVVYSNPALPQQTVGILDGFSKSSGDSATLNFSKPLDPTVAGFGADMWIGDGFSFDGTGCTGSGQFSLIHVNGTLVTSAAGCNDDSEDPVAQNGNLITVGAWNDPCTPIGETVIANDHEHYCLASLIHKGDTSIKVDTQNPSGDDNIFLEVFQVTGQGGTVRTGAPEPATTALVGAGLIGLALRRRRINKK